MNNVPTTEDRIWAVLSHLSALTFGMGILLPIIGWAEQRRKSNYASFQCLQALGYQSLGYTFWLLSYFLVFIALFITLIAFSFRAEIAGEIFDPLLGSGALIVFVLIFGFLALYFVFPIWAAISCALGRDFRYPILGYRLARYLEYSPATQDWLNDYHEHRWVAAMGHFAVIIALWGMLAPLTGSRLSSSGLPISRTFTAPEAGAGVAVTSTSTCWVCTTICVCTTVTGVGGADGAQLAITILQKTIQTNAMRICDFMLTPLCLKDKY